MNAPQRYRVAPFSGGDAGREFYKRNMDRGVPKSSRGDGDHCAICGRWVELHPTKPMIWAGVNTDLTWAGPGEGSGTQGAFIIGFDCDKKYRVVPEDPDTAQADYAATLDPAFKSSPRLGGSNVPALLSESSRRPRRPGWVFLAAFEGPADMSYSPEASTLARMERVHIQRLKMPPGARIRREIWWGLPATSPHARTI